ncbi:MAG: glycosyltransferase family 2 protein [Microgenomates group bacterium]
MKPKRTKVAVVTVNFNNSRITEDCIYSFAGISKKNIDLDLIVVDNGSVEEGSRKLEKKLPNVKFIYSKTNLGFAGGNNLGIEYALKTGATHILLINNDATIVEKNFLSEMMKAKGDIVSPLVKYPNNGKLTFDYGGLVDKLFGRNTHLHSLPKNIPDYFSGVCLLIKSKVFKKVGLLNDRFFLYYEDADFCLRAKKAGFKLGFCESSSIFHHLSTSANKFGKRKIYILANSHLWFCLKHLPFYSMPFYLSYNLYLRLKTLL